MTPQTLRSTWKKRFWVASIDCCRSTAPVRSDSRTGNHAIAGQQGATRNTVHFEILSEEARRGVRRPSAYIPSHGCNVISPMRCRIRTQCFALCERREEHRQLATQNVATRSKIFRNTSGHRLHSVPRKRSGCDRASAITFIFPGVWPLCPDPVCTTDGSEPRHLSKKGLGSSPALLVDVRYHGRIVREHQPFCPLKIKAECCSASLTAHQ